MKIETNPATVSLACEPSAKAKATPERRDTKAEAFDWRLRTEGRCKTHPADGFSASPASKPSSSLALSPRDSISCSRSRNSNFSLLDIFRFFLVPAPVPLLDPPSTAARGGADALPAALGVEEGPFRGAAVSSVCSLSAVVFEPPTAPIYVKNRVVDR